MTTNPTTDPQWARPFSRRMFLRGAGGALGVLALAPILEACASGKDAGPFEGAAAGRVDFANWPLYLDRRLDKGRVVRPSMQEFTRQTGIEVNYREVIPDADTFYRQIQPYLAAGKPTGWDIAVITNGATLTRMIELQQVMELPNDLRPNFNQHASEALAKDPGYDPGNAHTMPWQSGITGVAWNPALTGTDVKTLEHLFSGDLPGKIGLFSDSVDMPNLLMLAAGIEPETSTEAQWHEAAAWLQGRIDRGLRVTFFKQNYVNALANGDVVATMAWSGDIYQENAIGAPEGLQFATPSDGGLLWTDNMVIPMGAQHPVDAITLMDFVYRPEIAAMIAEFVAYVTPVPAARDQIISDANAATDPRAKERLQVLADSPLVFLPEEQASTLHTYRELKTDEELAAWNDAFGRFIA